MFNECCQIDPVRQSGVGLMLGNNANCHLQCFSTPFRYSMIDDINSISYEVFVLQRSIYEVSFFVTKIREQSIMKTEEVVAF